MMQKTRTSPNLELVSEAGSSKGLLGGTQGDRLERRRRPRLSLTAEQFRLDANGKIFSVCDLSEEGMALRVLSHEDLVFFPIAMEVQGMLNLKGTRFAVRAKVRHVGREMIGCEFDGLTSETQAAIERFLSPEILGRELRPIPTSEAGALWYHGPSGTDLLFWRGVDGQYHRIALYFRGSFIQWDQDEGLTTGRVQESNAPSEVHGVVRFETMVIQKDSDPDGIKLDIAKALILSSNLPEDMKRWCVRNLVLSS